MGHGVTGRMLAALSSSVTSCLLVAACTPGEGGDAARHHRSSAAASRHVTSEALGAAAYERMDGGVAIVGEVPEPPSASPSQYSAQSVLNAIGRAASSACVVRFEKVASRDVDGEFPVITEAAVQQVKALFGVCPSTASVLGGQTATRSLYVSEQPVLEPDVPSLAVFERTIDGAGQVLSFTTPMVGDSAVRVAAEIVPLVTAQQMLAAQQEVKP
jgi:hypothetical protein